MAETHRTRRTWLGRPHREAAPVGLVAPEPYEIRGLLGRGGMGEVYLAWDRDMEREVAFKVLRPACFEDDAVVGRFMAESRVLAALDHPAVVAVHARGRLEDGRPWYVMRIVRGETLDLWFVREQPLSRKLAKLVRVMDGLAYAHERGIVHCDLKPENVLVGPFGEVQILDWGIAQRVGDPIDLGWGTPGYMAPEQRTGGRVAPSLDAFAMGRLLHQVSTDPSVRALAEPLLAADPSQRPSMRDTVARVEQWIDGTESRTRAQQVLRRAEVQEREERRLVLEAERVRQAGQRLLDALPRDGSAEDKQDAWALLERADVLDADAVRAGAQWARLVHEALRDSPDLEDAHASLARFHHGRLGRASERGDRAEMALHRQLLAHHDRGQYAEVLSGRGRLTLHTDPPGLHVRYAPQVVRGRRRVSGTFESLGVTPLLGVSVPEGSGVLSVGGWTVPVMVGPGGHWRSGPADRPLRVPAPSEDCWVPAGFFRSGGDPFALDSISARTLWVDGFFARRFPVTCSEYLEFLNDLAAQGRLEDAWRYAPGQGSGDSVTYAVGHDNGRFVLAATDGLRWRREWPIAMLSWEGARAYALWRARRDGLPWRLPHDQEVEKLARGVDGRTFPWGDRFDPSWTRMIRSAGKPPLRGPVTAHPEDMSVYGVRGVAGNVRVWCANPYAADGPDARTVVQPREGRGDPAYRMIRGGSWLSESHFCRAASRFAGRPDVRHSSVGVRLVRSQHDELREAAMDDG